MTVFLNLKLCHCSYVGVYSQSLMSVLLNKPDKIVVNSDNTGFNDDSCLSGLSIIDEISPSIFHLSVRKA